MVTIKPYAKIDEDRVINEETKISYYFSVIMWVCLSSKHRWMGKDERQQCCDIWYCWLCDVNYVYRWSKFDDFIRTVVVYCGQWLVTYENLALILVLSLSLGKVFWQCCFSVAIKKQWRIFNSRYFNSSAKISSLKRINQFFWKNVMLEWSSWKSISLKHLWKLGSSSCERPLLKKYLRL